MSYTRDVDIFWDAFRLMQGDACYIKNDLPNVTLVQL